MNRQDHINLTTKLDKLIKESGNLERFEQLTELKNNLDDVYFRDASKADNQEWDKELFIENKTRNERLS